MSVTPTHLTTSGTTTDGTSFTTASIAPSANAILLLAVINTVGTGAAPDPTISGLGLTWDLVNSSGTSSRHLTVWRAKTGASPGSGAITISTGTTTTSSILWSIVEHVGADLSGVNGAGAIVQSFSAAPAAATSTSQPFPTTPTAGNAVFGAVGLAVNNVGSAGAGWTLGGATGVSSTAVGLLSEYDATDPLPTAVSASWSGSGNSFVVGVEIKAAAAGGATVSGDLVATASGAASFGGSVSHGAAVAAAGSSAVAIGGLASMSATLPAAAAAGAVLGGSPSHSGAVAAAAVATLALQNPATGKVATLPMSSVAALALAGQKTVSSVLAMTDAAAVAIAAQGAGNAAISMTDSGLLVVGGSPTHSAVLSLSRTAVLALTGQRTAVGALAASAQGHLVISLAIITPDYKPTHLVLVELSSDGESLATLTDDGVSLVDVAATERLVDISKRDYWVIVQEGA